MTIEKTIITISIIKWPESVWNAKNELYQCNKYMKTIARKDEIHKNKGIIVVDFKSIASIKIQWKNYLNSIKIKFHTWSIAHIVSDKSDYSMHWKNIVSKFA